ncbi:hypothetical protein KUA19_40025 [Catellatospora sp. NEAU-YM18]|nr:hypothetical protein [Catellatospora tritici]
MLTLIISGAGHMWHGYQFLHIASAWARVVTVTHLVVMVAMFGYGTYVGHAYVMTEDGHLPDAERYRRFRRANAWNRRRFVPVLLALLVFMFGYPMPARDKWALVVDLKWLIPYIIVWIVASSVFAAILRAVREEPKGVGENSASFASLFVILIWAFPLSRRGMEVLGVAAAWSWVAAVTLLAFLLVATVVAVLVVPGFFNGVLPGRPALTVILLGGTGLLLYLLPLIWNDRPVVHDLTDITGIPFLG